jgi:hypothetical protein
MGVSHVLAKPLARADLFRVLSKVLDEAAP